jgi:hypothetical protein
MELEITIRDANPDDINFIYSTWLESYRYDSYFGKSHRNTIFFNDYRKVIDRLLEISKTIVACDPSETSVIYGYLTFEPSVLHYAFTKGPFKRLGVFTTLFNAAFPSGPVEYTHRTYDALPIIIKNERLTHRATLLLKT